MKENEVRNLPAAVDVVTAGKALGLGRSKSYALAQSGDFPIPLMRLGAQYRARRADLLALLGIPDQTK
ncbi:hypothetical protein OG741_19335 [Streptomyces sp. NBC_01410]|uniref:hypothetical protein n=1 Tax=Streptomyces sp. NBC_01410 TaxID=2903856 RepID=UPI00324461B9